MANGVVIRNTLEPLDSFVSRSHGFMKDWLLFNQILGAYPSPGSDKAKLETQFLQIKSKLVKEHSVLKERLGPDFKISNDALEVIFGAPTLQSVYAQSEVAVKKLSHTWHRAYISINETIGQIEEKKKRAEAGERITIGGITIDLHYKRRNLRRYFVIAGSVLGVVLFAFTIYFMRNFLGFWAPGAGEGIHVTDAMTDDQKIDAMLATMKQAVESADIDTLMTAFSDRLADDKGRGKTELRALLQTFKTSGQMKDARMDYSRAQRKIEGDTATIIGVNIDSSAGSVTLSISGAKENGKWLIVALSGLGN